MILRILSGSRPAFALAGNILMAGDKGPSGGSDGLTIKQQLDQANTDLKLSAEQVAKLEGDLKASGEQVTKLEGEVKALGEQVAKLEGDLKLSAEQVTKSEGDLKLSGEQVTKLEGEVKTAKTELKNADDRAESRVLEGIAKNGGVLPAKDHKAGNKSDEREPDKSETPQKRLASIFKIQG